MITVFRSKFVSGAATLGEDAHGRPLERGAVADLSAVLVERYDSDAHGVMYYLPPGHPLHGARLLSRLPPEVLSAVRFDYLFFDVDCADPLMLPMWRIEVESTLSAHNLAWYATRNGYRILFRHAAPVGIGEHIEAIRRGIDWLAGLGIEADRACVDWTRLYRMPHVIRDGEALDYPHAYDSVPVAEFGESPFAGIESAPVPVPPLAAHPRIETGGRNTAMAKVAMSYARRGAGVAESIARVSEYNARCCVPPLPAVEIEAMCRTAVHRTGRVDVPVAESRRARIVHIARRYNYL